MEKRRTEWVHRPYEGGMIDGPNNGIAPQPWDIAVQMPQLFEEDEVEVPVPHTEYAQQCSDCFGRGRVQCKHCKGRGRDECTWCDGRGQERRGDETVRCTHCNGEGRVRCTWCDGDGMVRCKTCKGNGNIVMFVKLTVTFTNHVDNQVIDASGMPADMVRDASGTLMCQWGWA